MPEINGSATNGVLAELTAGSSIAKALDDVQLFSVRRTKRIDEGPGVQANRIQRGYRHSRNGQWILQTMTA